MKVVKIKDNDDLVRDTKSNAVLNTDMSSLEKYRARREKERQMNSDVEELKEKMTNIENLLNQLVNREMNK